MPDILYARAEHTKSPIRFRNPMELNNSNAASAFFTFLLFNLLKRLLNSSLFVLHSSLSKAIEFFTLRSSLFT